MSQKEIVNTLEVQAKIEPDFTELGSENICSLFFHFYFAAPTWL